MKGRKGRQDSVKRDEDVARFESEAQELVGQVGQMSRTQAGSVDAQ